MNLTITNNGNLCLNAFDNWVSISSLSSNGTFYLDAFMFSFYVLEPDGYEDLHIRVEWGRKHKTIKITWPIILFCFDVY